MTYYPIITLSKISIGYGYSAGGTVARYFMVQAQSLGTADGSNYVTVTVGLEGIS